MNWCIHDTFTRRTTIAKGQESSSTQHPKRHSAKQYHWRQILLVCFFRIIPAACNCFSFSAMVTRNSRMVSCPCSFSACQRGCRHPFQFHEDMQKVNVADGEKFSIKNEKEDDRQGITLTTSSSSCISNCTASSSLSLLWMRLIAFFTLASLSSDASCSSSTRRHASRCN